MYNIILMAKESKPRKPGKECKFVPIATFTDWDKLTEAMRKLGEGELMTRFRIEVEQHKEEPLPLTPPMEFKSRIDISPSGRTFEEEPYPGRSGPQDN